MSWWSFKRKQPDSTDGGDPAVADTKRPRGEGVDGSATHPDGQPLSSPAQRGRHATLGQREPPHWSSHNHALETGSVAGRGQRNKTILSPRKLWEASNGRAEAATANSTQTDPAQAQDGHGDPQADIRDDRKRMAFALGQECLAMIRDAATPPT